MTRKDFFRYREHCVAGAAPTVAVLDKQAQAHFTRYASAESGYAVLCRFVSYFVCTGPRCVSFRLALPSFVLCCHLLVSTCVLFDPLSSVIAVGFVRFLLLMCSDSVSLRRLAPFLLILMFAG